MLAISALLCVLLQWICFSKASKSSDVAPGSGSCVALNSEDSELNRHLCEIIGLRACREPVSVLNVRSSLIGDAINREKCIRTVFGLFATIACQRRTPVEQYIYSTKPNDITVAYLCPDVCKAVWMACSPRANSPFADMLADEESKSICKSIALKQSAVQIRQGVEGKCISTVIGLSETEVAEINWLLGGRVNWHFVKLRRHGIGIMILFLVLAGGAAYSGMDRRRRLRRLEEAKKKDQESETFLELNINMY